MPKVHKQVAAKDYPADGILKGESYYSWQLHGQRVQRSKTPPRPSQLTGSDKLSRAYAAQEALQDAIQAATSPDELAEALQTAAEATREVADEYNESADNMEQAFPNGSPNIESCREKAEALNSFADECDDAAATIESLELSDYDGDEETKQESLMDDARDTATEPSLEL